MFLRSLQLYIILGVVTSIIHGQFEVPDIGGVIDDNTGCDPATDPGTKCFLDVLYPLQHQWGTCLDSAQVQQRSGDQYQCKDTTANHCYYPCTADQFNVYLGLVNDACACEEGDVPPDVPPEAGNVGDVPSWCHNPSGEDCSWYSECLNVKFDTCEENDDHPYAISYADHFCNLYMDSIGSFSVEGQRWVNAVRKCLQVAIAPQLQLDPSCQVLKERAFATHTPCYVQPEPDVSFCALSDEDQARVAYTIKGAIISAPSDTWQGYKEVTAQCEQRNQPTTSKGTIFLKNVKFVLDDIIDGITGRRRRRQATSPSEWDIASAMVDSMVNTFGLDPQLVTWVAIPENVDLVAGQMDILVILINKLALGVVDESIASSPEATRFNLDDVIDALELAISSDSFDDLQMEFGTVLTISEVLLCRDAMCDETDDPDESNQSTPSDPEEGETSIASPDEADPPSDDGDGNAGNGGGGKGKGKGGQPSKQGKGRQPSKQGKGRQPSKQGKERQPSKQGKGRQPSKNGKGRQAKRRGKGRRPARSQRRRGKGRGKGRRG